MMCGWVRFTLRCVGYNYRRNGHHAQVFSNGLDGWYGWIYGHGNIEGGPFATYHEAISATEQEFKDIEAQRRVQ